MSVVPWPPSPPDGKSADRREGSKRTRPSIGGMAGGWLLVGVVIFEWFQGTMSPPPPGPPPIDGWDVGGLVGVTVLVLGLFAARGRVWASAITALVALPFGLLLGWTLVRET